MEDKLKVLDESLSYFFDKKVILFIGSGISKIAGCYDWDTIIQKLLNDDCLFKDIGPKDFIESKKQNNEKIQFLEERYNKAGKEKKFYGILREAITADPEIYNQKYIPFIKSLKNMNPFPIILTTNIDSCLEDSKKFDFERIYYEIDDFKKENLVEDSIFHIHGYKEKFLSSLFSKKAYQRIYENNIFKNFVDYVFLKYCIIFIGYSFNDNELRQLILNVRNERNVYKNYILVPENEFSKADIAMNRDLYNLYTIEYEKVESFPEIFSSWIIRNFPAQRIESSRSFAASSGRDVPEG